MTVREMYDNRLEEFVKEIQKHSSDEELTEQAKINMLDDLHDMAFELRKETICTLLLSLYNLDINKLKADTAKGIGMNRIHMPKEKEMFNVLMCMLGIVHCYIGDDLSEIISKCEELYHSCCDGTEFILDELPFD